MKIMSNREGTQLVGRACTRCELRSGRGMGQIGSMFKMTQGMECCAEPDMHMQHSK